MAEVDLSSPIAVIVGFFVLVISAFTYFFRVIQFIFVGGGGLLAIMGGLIGGLFIWFKLLGGNR